MATQLTLTADERAALIELLDYIQPSEEKDANITYLRYGDTDGHIIEPIRRLRAAIKR